MYHCGMAVESAIRNQPVADLCLDPLNPRLGRKQVETGLSQPQVLAIMKDWELEELAISFLESGFWPQEALITTTEQIDGAERLVVVEGNRRLAALKILLGERPERLSGSWQRIFEEASPEVLEKLKEIPCIHAESRRDVQEFLGFRHVSGIKQWEPAEKAEFIAHLIDDLGYSYEGVMRKIGSKTEPVRRNYISYRILQQMEESEEIYSNAVVQNFSVLFLSLRTHGAQKYLNIDIEALPEVAQRPVPTTHIKNLENFAKWLFGTEQDEPLVPESRAVDRFGKILESEEAIEYLETARKPSFEMAYRKAGGAVEESLFAIERASYEIEGALGTIHLFKEDERLIEAVTRLLRHCNQLSHIFPTTTGKADVAP